MTDLEHAVEIFHGGAYAFVLVKNDQIIATGASEGIGELLDAIVEFPDAVRGASLADKIVGKAVAMIAIHAGIAEIYTPLGSESAAEVLAKYRVPFHSQRMVPVIQNKRNDGACPMERLTMPITDPEVAVAALKTFVAQRHAPLPTV